MCQRLIEIFEGKLTDCRLRRPMNPQPSQQPENATNTDFSCDIHIQAEAKTNTTKAGDVHSTYPQDPPEALIEDAAGAVLQAECSSNISSPVPISMDAIDEQKSVPLVIENESLPNQTYSAEAEDSSSKAMESLVKEVEETKGQLATQLETVSQCLSSSPTEGNGQDTANVATPKRNQTGDDIVKPIFASPSAMT